MPKFLSSCLEDFEKFYLQKHQGQKLLWCLGLSKVNIEYLYLKQKNISSSTLPQLLSLLILEKKGKLSLGKIAELCGCQVSTIITDIQGLIFNPTFNPQCDPNKGIIVGTSINKEKEFKENDEIEEAQIIKRYQDNILQATITRIMKSKIGQETTHVWLVGEAAKQIDLFKAQPQQIKENIEKLIEKNVIKRNAKNRTCYDYIA